VDASGRLTAVNEGDAMVVARAGSLAETTLVSVKKTPPQVVAVDLTPPDTIVPAGGTLRLSAAVRGENDAVLAGREVRWRSANATIASVDSMTGAVIGRSAGRTTITARTLDGKSATARIRVVALVARIQIATGRDTIPPGD